MPLQLLVAQPGNGLDDPIVQLLQVKIHGPFLRFV
jgi:hypothetical protein